MKLTNGLDGATRLGQALARYRTAIWTVAVLSAVLNVLVLAGSVYIQDFDGNKDMCALVAKDTAYAAPTLASP